MNAFIIGIILSAVWSQIAVTNEPAGVVLVSPSADYGQTQAIAVQRIAARFEQQTSLPEVRQIRVSSNDVEETLRTQCAGNGTGSKVLYVDAATTHDLRPGDFYKATILLTVYDCQTKKIASVIRQAPVSGAKGWEDPLISAGYRSIEASAVNAVADKQKMSDTLWEPSPTCAKRSLSARS